MEAAKTLSLYSHCLAIAIPPTAEEMVLKRIKFVHFEKNKVLAILISESGFVYSRIIELERTFNQKQLDNASNHLNKRFRGQTIKEVGDMITKQIDNERITCDKLITNLLTLCRDIITSKQDQTPSAVLTQFTLFPQCRISIRSGHENRRRKYFRYVKNWGSGLCPGGLLVPAF